MPVRMILCAIACVGFGLAPLQADAADFDATAFDRLGKEDKLAFVKAALQQRDAALQNFAYELSRSERNISLHGGPDKPWGKHFYDLKRKEGSLLLHGRRFAAGGKFRGEFWTNWNGSVSRSLTRRPHYKSPRGLIKDSESANFSQTYNHMLGLRMVLSQDERMSAGEWLEHVMAKGWDTEVKAVQQDGKSLIRFIVTKGALKRHYDLNPARGFMPVRYERLYKRGEAYNSLSMRVAQARQVDGLWVPTKVVQLAGTSADTNWETETLYEVSEFTRGTVADKDLEVAFPPGTDVVDMIRRVHYRVLPNGSMEFLPLYDSDTGKVIDPSITSVEDAVNNALADNKAAATRPTMPNVPRPSGAIRSAPGSPAETGHPSKWFWPGVLIAAAGLLLVGLGSRILIVRRRCRGAADTRE